MSRQYREVFHLLGEVHPTNPHEPCRPGMAHVKECGDTSDHFECACGCTGDEAWCVAEANLKCEIDSCNNIKCANDLCEEHLKIMGDDYSK